VGIDREQAVLANRARLLAQPALPPPVPDDVADELLRSTVCARCGYDLTGLPVPIGTCPGCGRAYGGAEICLYGYGTGSKRTDWTRNPPNRWQLVWRWAVLIVAVAAMASSYQLRIFVWAFWYWPASACVGLFIITWRGLTDQPADAVQVRLSPAGVRQLNRGWGPIPYDRVDAAKPVPWRKVHWLAVQAVGEGQLRVSMKSSEDLWTFQRVYVDAIVRCPPDAVAAVRQRVTEWRAAADRR